VPNQVLTVLDEKAVNVLLFCDCLNLSVNLFRREILLRCIFLFYPSPDNTSKYKQRVLTKPTRFFFCAGNFFFFKRCAHYSNIYVRVVTFYRNDEIWFYVMLSSSKFCQHANDDRGNFQRCLTSTAWYFSPVSVTIIIINKCINKWL
jgi:hypothetical protein